jgi:Rps23 Pro-64 3,4-dihydroxylase Tpa1-like proline 4-hydroxylase
MLVVNKYSIKKKHWFEPTFSKSKSNSRNVMYLKHYQYFYLGGFAVN